MIPETETIWAERTVRAINSAFPDPEFANWSQCERLAPHANHAAKHVTEYAFKTPEAGRLLGRMASYLTERGSYTDAIRLCEQALTILSESDQHGLDSASFLRTKGLAFFSLGRYSEAEQCLAKARADQEAVLGGDHLDYARTLDYLGVLYQTEERFAEAESMFQQARKIRKIKQGENHPDYATSLNYIGTVHGMKGNLRDAKFFFRQSLEIRKNRLSKDDPDVAISLGNLALMHLNSREYPEAEDFAKDALRILEASVGNRHVEYANCLHTLALTYHFTGRHGEVEPMVNEVLDCYRDSVGEEHPNFKYIKLTKQALLNQARSGMPAMELRHPATRSDPDHRFASSASWSVTVAMLGVCLLFGSAPLIGGWCLGFIAMTAGILGQVVGLFVLIRMARAFGIPRGLKAAMLCLVLGGLVAFYAASGMHGKFKARMYYHSARTFEGMGKFDDAKEFYNKAHELDPTLLPNGERRQGRNEH